MTKDGQDSVVPVVIAALAPILAKLLKDDRSLCPVIELGATIWAGLQTSGRIKNCSLSPLRNVSTKIYHLPLSHHESSRL